MVGKTNVHEKVMNNKFNLKLCTEGQTTSLAMVSNFCVSKNHLKVIEQ